MVARSPSSVGRRKKAQTAPLMAGREDCQADGWRIRHFSSAVTEHLTETTQGSQLGNISVSQQRRRTSCRGSVSGCAVPKHGFSHHTRSRGTERWIEGAATLSEIHPELLASISKDVSQTDKPAGYQVYKHQSVGRVSLWDHQRREESL